MRTTIPGRLQELPHFFCSSGRVRVRGQLWRITQLQRYDACTVVHLAGIDRDNQGDQRALLHPFDHIQPASGPTRLRVVRRGRWRRAFLALLRDGHPHDALRAALAARIELLPFQLEPALAVARGLASRLLLADEVGLGKTIQAGVLLAELRARGLANRVLILTPAGLRRQWQAELHERFSIDAMVIDSALLRRRASSLPVGTNPWLLDEVAITSIDLIKRPEAMRGLASIAWDLLLIDEAHVAAQATHRRAAAEALARRARRVVLMTATPHDGDASAFAALRRIGELDDQPLAMFRRTRGEVGLSARRRVRTLAVELGPEESHMHRLLRRYAELVCDETGGRSRDARLAMVVLMKRALSSPLSLQISIERRIQLLSEAEKPIAETQLPLPLGDDETDERDLEPLAILGTPGLRDRTHELACLGEIGTAARAVSIGRKVQVLARFLARVTEPALVFTEYRDTLQHVAAALTASLKTGKVKPDPATGSDTPAGQAADLAVVHGGLSETERIQAQTAFTRGSARVLLATDAAGEGLNLQSRCRLVVNLELPWNPMRLEQRIGRVDRLGQARAVHAINLFARGTVERNVLARLVTRLDRARQDVGRVNDPLGVRAGFTTSVVSAFTRTQGRLRPATTDVVEPRTEGDETSSSDDDLTGTICENARSEGEAAPEAVWQPDLRDEAIAEASRLQALRRMGTRLKSPGPLVALVATPDHETLVTTIPKVRLRSLVSSPSIIWLIRTRLVDGNGQLVEQMVIPFVGPCVGPSVGPLLGPVSIHQAPAVRTLVQRMVEAAGPALRARARAISEDRLRSISDTHRVAVDAARTRELALMRTTEAESCARRPLQVGLFDRRAARDYEAGLRQRALAAAAEVTSVRQIDEARDLAIAGDPELALVLLVADR